MQKKREYLLLGIHEDINLVFTTNPKQHQVLRLEKKKKKSSYRHETKPKPQDLISLKNRRVSCDVFVFLFFWQPGRNRRELKSCECWGLGHGRREEDKEKNNCSESTFLIQIHLSSTQWKADSEVERISGSRSRRQKYLNLCWAIIS